MMDTSHVYLWIIVLPNVSSFRLYIYIDTVLHRYSTYTNSTEYFYVFERNFLQQQSPSWFSYSDRPANSSIGSRSWTVQMDLHTSRNCIEYVFPDFAIEGTNKNFHHSVVFSL